jgi:hypothetical protein
MRIRKKDGIWIPHFSVVWEVTQLTDAGNVRVPFALSKHTQPIGDIDAQTHAIHFYNEEPGEDNIVVSLLPAP